MTYSLFSVRPKWALFLVAIGSLAVQSCLLNAVEAEAAPQAVLPAPDAAVLMAPLPEMPPMDAPPAVVSLPQIQLVALVNGMTCDFCVRSIQSHFLRHPAVEGVGIDLDAKTVTLLLVPGAEMSDAQLSSLLAEVGYSVIKVVRQNASK